MKNKIFLSILITSLLLGSSSCSGWLDINENPNVATSVESEVLFGYALLSWAGNLSGGDSNIPFAFAGQTQSTGGSFGWGDDDVYKISPYALGNSWTALYATIGTNLKSAIDLAEKANLPNIAAQCKILLAQSMYGATMTYGDIPYSESWKDDIASPKFDSQESVLNDLINLLDEAIEDAKKEGEGIFPITSYDLIYKGDMKKWIAFANSLKFKIAITMVDADPGKSTLIADLLQKNSMIKSASENFSIDFINAPSKENPKFKLLDKYGGGQNDFFFANSNVVNIMKPMKDPRLNIYFTAGKEAGEDIIGIETNDLADEKTARISMYIFRPDAPCLAFSYQEQLFFEAEVYARGLGVSKDLNKANDLFKSAVKEALQYYNAAPEKIDDFISNQLPDLTTAADPVKEIHLQQWVDLMDRPLDAFTQWRRSGTEGNEVPTLSLPKNAPAGELFRRFEYAPDEVTTNPNAPKGVKYYTKMWFDK